jgi:hypothetical protein
MWISVLLRYTIASKSPAITVRAIIARMGDSETPKPAHPTPLKVTSPPVDKMMCERCGVAEMYRMHAVWRCPACGFKTDCCGW